MIITLKKADFSLSNIGTLSTYSIKFVGTGVTNTNTSVDRESNTGYTTTITFDEGYELNGSITVTMDGTDITSTAVSGLTITIPTKVTGNVVITVPTVKTSTGEEDSGNTDNSVLPDGYQAVEYLETDGTQYFVFSGEKISSNASYEIKFSAAQVTSITALIGSYSTTDEAARSQIRLSSQKDSSSETHNGLEWMYGSQGAVAKANVAETQISAEYWTGTNTLKVDANKLYWNDTLLKTYNEETFTTSQTDFTLFAQNNNNTAGDGTYARQSSVKCYSVKIIDAANSINRELVPCYRTSDNVIGFYDIVNSSFIAPTEGTITSKGANI